MLFPWKFLIPNRIVRRISPAVPQSDKLFSDSPLELTKTQSFFASPSQSDPDWSEQENKHGARPLSEANTKPSS